MRIIILSILFAFSIQLSAKKAPKWKDGNFKTTASGLQYKIVKEGKGDSIRNDDAVMVDMYSYSSKDHSLIESDNYGKQQKTMVEMDDEKILEGIKQSIRLLKKGGNAYFKIPPALGKDKNGDTLFCFIRVNEIIHKRDDVLPVDSAKTQNDTINITIKDPEKKYFGDTLFSLMKLVEQPQIVSCGTLKVMIAFKFEMTTFNNGVQHKDILVFIQCPDFYGKDYFVAGANYMVTCIPLYDDLKNGNRTMNSYSLEKLDKYYGLRVRKM